MASSGRQAAFSAVILSLFSVVHAQNATTDAPQDTPAIEPHQVDAVSIIFCLVLAGLGSTLALYGFKWFRFTLFVTGFLVCSDIALAVLMLVLPPTHENAGVVGVVYLLTLVGTGLVGGCIMACLRRRGLSLIGLMGAFVAARLVRCAFPLLPVWGHIAVLVGAVVLAVVGNWYAQRPTVIFSTSLSGAFLIIVGVDLITANGLLFHSVSRGENGEIHVSAGAWMELGAIGVITLLTAAFQFWKHDGCFGDDEPEKVRYQSAKNPVVL